jgi:hypothetical protein
MAEHIWTIFCQHAIVDRETNSISYLVGIEEIGAAQLPFLFAGTLGSLWVRDGDNPETLEVRYQLITPTGKSKDMGETIVNMEKPRQRLNANLSIGIDEEGVYHLRVSAKRGDKWKQAARIPFIVSVQKPDEGLETRSQQ